MDMESNSTTTIELCAGYGGLSLGLGLKPTFYAEIYKPAIKVFDHHFDAENLGDITERTVWPKGDVLLAGFPCQPSSTMGKMAGKDDKRWLWPYIQKAIKQINPHTIFLENVPGIKSVNDGAALKEILQDLAGYNIRYTIIPANHLGICHLRKRWFLLATKEPSKNAGFVEIKYKKPKHKLLPTPTYQNSRPSVTSTRKPTSKFQPRITLGDIVFLNSWGEYEESLSIHQKIAGRKMPKPTYKNKNVKAKNSLSPKFIEWLMLLEEGYITDIDISNTAKMRVLGNGVIPLQAKRAFQILE